jgi:hypothetical protein
MPRSKEYRLPSPLALDEIVEVDRRARQSLPDYESAFPQVVKFSVNGKSGWLPPIRGIPGFSVAMMLRLRCRLDAARMSPEFTAGMIEGMLGIRPGDGQPPDIEISCSFELPVRRGGLLRGAQFGWITAKLEEGGPEFEFYGGGYTLSDDRGDFHGEDLASRYAVERGNMTEIIEKVAEAGRLPIQVSSVRFSPREVSFTVEHTEGGEVNTYHGPHEYGTTHFNVGLPGISARDLARRFHDILAVIPSTAPFKYSCMSYIWKGKQKNDPCPQVYEHWRAQKWPATSFDLEAGLNLDSAGGIEGLKKFTALQRRGFRLPLGQIKLDARRVAKLLAQVKPDGHHLLLQLPPEDEPKLARFERILGISFVK